MKKLTLALVMLSAACATLQHPINSASAGLLPGQTAEGIPPTISGSPFDFIGQLVKTIRDATPEARAFIARDLAAANARAIAANEHDGMTCLPALAECNSDPVVCFADKVNITGLFSLAEARITGVTLRQLLLPPKLHEKCSAWVFSVVQPRIP